MRPGTGYGSILVVAVGRCSEETRAFAQMLMEEVWEPFDSSATPRFYHRDVIGHHRHADGSTQELGYADFDYKATGAEGMPSR